MKYIALALTAPFILILGAYIVITFGFTIPPNFFMYVVGVILFVIGLLMTLIAISGISTDIRELKRPIKSIESKRKEPVLKEKPKPKKPKIERLKKAIETIKPKPKIEKKEIKKPVERIEKKKVKTQKIKDKEKLKRKDKGLSGRLKQITNSIGSIDDIQGFINEKLSSTTPLREIGESNIIWSFDDSKLDETLRKIIMSGKKEILMTYPWIREMNLDVVKKLISVDNCKLIVQEANLDDEIATSILKLLIDNGVKIKVMENIPTIAAVVDNKQGILISTDPIYDSFEVGSVYKDKESVSKIKKLFEEAWGISKEIGGKLT